VSLLAYVAPLVVQLAHLLWPPIPAYSVLFARCLRSPELLLPLRQDQSAHPSGHILALRH